MSTKLPTAAPKTPVATKSTPTAAIEAGGPSSAKVDCKMCKEKAHILIPHIVEKHRLAPIDYLAANPGAPLWSGYGLVKIREFSTSTLAKSMPRPRKDVDIKELFPTFGIKRGYEVEGAYPCFATPDPVRTPRLNAQYRFPEEATLDFLAIVEKAQRNRIYIAGWSGTGKSDLVRNIAAKLGAPLIEIYGDAYKTRAEMIGRWKVVDGNMVFVYGPVPIALRTGAWLVAHEFDTFSPLAVNILKPVLEDPAHLMIDETGDEMIQAHEDFRAIATANTFARGDSSGLFVNTHTQSDADARRWSARIRLDYMPADDEKDMLQGYFPELDEPTAENFVKVGNKVRESFKAGKIDKTFSPAELINWCENYLTCGKGFHHAARISFLNALEPDVSTAIGEMVNAVFGQETP